KKAGLPELLIDFIRTHHGTTRVEVFYRKYLEANPDVPEGIENEFRYPGPLPTSKEQTIMMVADSLEAASKSLKNPTEEAIRDLTNKIIAGKIAQGQFNESELSFEELEICKETFIKTLISIHHVRIAYPEDKKEQEKA
ncbi:MAG: phosphohydrolase, partial [Bacteroidota bacterium]